MLKIYGVYKLKNVDIVVAMNGYSTKVLNSKLFTYEHAKWTKMKVRELKLITEEK